MSSRFKAVLFVGFYFFKCQNFSNFGSLILLLILMAFLGITMFSSVRGFPFLFKLFCQCFTVMIKKGYRYLKKVIHQTDRKWTIAPLSKFYAKLEFAFVLTHKNAFSQRFHLKANRRCIASSKKRYQAFSKQPSV